MQNSLVSVIICSYNNWPDLELALRSVLAQTYQPIEVIVVDNGSADMTWVEVPRLFGKLVRFTTQANRGDSGAYNAGLAVASGEFIQFMDGDDIVLPHKIEAQVAAFRQHPDIGIVYGDVRKFQSASGEGTLTDFNTWDYDDVLEMLLSFDGNGAGIGTLNTLISRATVDRVGPWDESLYNSDLDYMIRAAWLGCRFQKAGGLVAFYRQRSGQMTADRHAMLSGIEAVWSKAAGYILAGPHAILIQKTLAYQRLYMSATDLKIGRPKAFSFLTLAWETRPNPIPTWAYIAVLLIIYVPGARRLLRSSLLRKIRQAMRHLLRYPSTAFRLAPEQAGK